MNITTIEQLDLIYVNWQNDLESIEFANWAMRHPEYDLEGDVEVPETVAILDHFYADTKLKH